MRNLVLHTLLPALAAIILWPGIFFLRPMPIPA